MYDQYSPFTHLGDPETVSKWRSGPPRSGKITKTRENHTEPLGQNYVDTVALHLRTYLCFLAPQETPSPPPATYTLVNKLRNKKVNSVPSYVEPEEDYDDVAIPENMEKHHLETSMSPFWPAEEGSHNLF